jgi:predicted TIM-barrel fold metal-dependent hydrolase
MAWEEDMTQSNPVKIDAFSHVTPAKYLEALDKLSPRVSGQAIVPTRPVSPPLYDLDHRFRIMDRFEGLVQVLTLGFPAIEDITTPEKAPDLARLANDQMAELVTKYPDRFIAAIAYLPMNNIEAALREADRAIKDLKFRGVYVNSHVNGKPLDSPEFMALYEKMSHYDLPIYIHPHRTTGFADYATETEAKYDTNSVFGWLYDTTVAMTRMVFSGILEKYPNLKVVTHHCGAMVPYFEQRIIQHYTKYQVEYGRQYMEGLSKAPIEYYRMFYTDTAIHGNPLSLMCANDFYGAGHLLFAADMPLGDLEFGNRSYRQTIEAIEAMEITEAERKAIFGDNAKRLLRLPL